MQHYTKPALGQSVMGSTPLSIKLLLIDEAGCKDLNPYSRGEAGANYLTLGRTLVPIDHYKIIESRLNKLDRMTTSGTLGRQEMSREWFERRPDIQLELVRHV